MKSYKEMSKLETFEERYKYAQLKGTVGQDTFGFDRFLNQQFYNSGEWRRIRNQVIVRDNGCDLGHPDHPIRGRVIIHHMNPIEVEDFGQNGFINKLMDPDNLVCVSHDTHNAIHYGDENLLPKEWRR